MLLVTDVDGPLGNCEKIARKLGLGKIYEECKNNLAKLEVEIRHLDTDLNEIAYTLVNGFEINAGVVDTLENLKERGYKNCACTDNPIFGNGFLRDLFKEKFCRDGECLLDEIYATSSIDTENKRIARLPGGKIEYVKNKFEDEKGILVVDDRNDMEVAKYVKEHYPKVKVVKVGENCKELEKFSDYSFKSFYEILKIA